MLKMKCGAGRPLSSRATFGHPFEVGLGFLVLRGVCVTPAGVEPTAG